ncbi:FAD dependent oxidoreductase [Niveomyces insectorum RCEF 264]|uniref:Fumarate reductase n=1 Tax=Niveomyces insectorum RCEF 264 TaxID=1081102 RepID=A0A167VAI0_9HYPO|nr:FAD dependent oxidoreductase [Niveomyces insectorum RCEF 264]
MRTSLRRRLLPPTLAVLVATFGVFFYFRYYGQNPKAVHIAASLSSLSSSPSPCSLSPSLPLRSMPSSEDQRCAVIVVGSGLAGLSAALSSLHANASSVVLLERASRPGGNSIKASSGINGAPTRFQNRASPDTAFFADTVKSAGKRMALLAAEQPQRERLIALLTNSSAAAVDFLADEIGVDMSVVTQLGGHSVARTHRGAGKTPPGADIVTKLLNKLKEDSRFELKTDCEVTRLLSRPPRDGTGGISTVVGVEYRSGGQTVSIAGPVIFATGGFAGDADGMLSRYRHDLAGMPSTNDPRPGMHHLLTDVGAKLVDMDSVQIHPTGFVDPADPRSPLKFLAAEILRGEGGILLRDGQRFVNELETREHVSRAIMDFSPEGHAPRQWSVQLLLDPGACGAAESHVAFYMWKGLLVKKKISELDEPTRETIRTYSLAAAGQREDQFGKTAFGHWRPRAAAVDLDMEMCVGTVTPVTHFTMGGVAINEKGQVLSSDLASEHQVPVGGLWAAGEVTGGIHGDNRLGGSSLLECVVFGRIAGAQAAAYSKDLQ